MGICLACLWAPTPVMGDAGDRWSPAGGWRELPDVELSFPNGILASLNAITLAETGEPPSEPIRSSTLAAESSAYSVGASAARYR